MTRNPSPFRIALALALAAFVAFAPVTAIPVAAHPPDGAVSVAGFASAVQTTATAALVRYVGSTAGLPTVAVDATTGDLTFQLAAAAVDEFECPVSGALGGIIDVSDAACDTFGEVVNVINASDSWRIVLVSSLASDLSTNAIFTLSATDASGPAGVRLFRDETVASATSVFSAQVALLPAGAESDIGFFLSTGGGPTGARVNTDPLVRYQTFVQHIREQITSSGTVALFEVLGVRRTYDSNGRISDTVRTLYAETGAATTAELERNFHPGPVVAAPGELVIVRQRTGTALTVASINGSGYMVRK